MADTALVFIDMDVFVPFPAERSVRSGLSPAYLSVFREQQKAQTRRNGNENQAPFVTEHKILGIMRND